MNTHDLALKAANGMLSFDAEGEWRLNQKEVERFAHLVRAQTLEEAAGVCDARSLADFPQTQTGMGFSFSQQWDAARTAEKQCAAAIRALKEQT